MPAPSPAHKEESDWSGYRGPRLGNGKGLQLRGRNAFIRISVIMAIWGSRSSPVLTSHPQAPRWVIRTIISRASATVFLEGCLESSATKPTPQASLSLFGSKRPCGSGIAECLLTT
jgi:hypothetical protein